jgi:hypothetical protein
MISQAIALWFPSFVERFNHYLIDIPPFRSSVSKIFFFVCDEEPLLGFQGPVLWNQVCLSPLIQAGRTPPQY